MAMVALQPDLSGRFLPSGREAMKLGPIRRPNHMPRLIRQRSSFRGASCLAQRGIHSATPITLALMLLLHLCTFARLHVSVYPRMIASRGRSADNRASSRNVLLAGQADLRDVVRGAERHQNSTVTLNVNTERHALRPIR